MISLVTAHEISSKHISIDLFNNQSAITIEFLIIRRIFFIRTRISNIDFQDSRCLLVHLDQNHKIVYIHV